MNVYNITNRKDTIDAPTVEHLLGSLDLPLWFVNEVNTRLASKERYSFCAGLGLLLRAVPHLGTSARVNSGLSRCERLLQRLDAAYLQSVCEAAIYEVDDLLDGFPILSWLFTRNPAVARKQIQDMKRRRDDVESVSRVFRVVDKYQAVILLEAARVDALAACYVDKLVDASDDPKLSFIQRINPTAWWGVKGDS